MMMSRASKTYIAIGMKVRTMIMIVIFWYKRREYLYDEEETNDVHV